MKISPSLNHLATTKSKFIAENALAGMEILARSAK